MRKPRLVGDEMTCPESHSVWSQAGIRSVLPRHMPLHHPLTLPVLEEKDLSFASFCFSLWPTRTSMENPTCLSGEVLFPSQGVDDTEWTFGFQTLKHCCSWGVWKWIGQVSQMWRGKNIYLPVFFFPRGHKTGEWGTKSGRLPSILSGISATQNYSLSASFLDPTWHLNSSLSPIIVR